MHIPRLAYGGQRESVLSFCNVGSGDQTQMLGLEAGTSAHSPGHLTGLLPFPWVVYVSAHEGGSEAEVSSIETYSLSCECVCMVCGYMYGWIRD